MREQVGVCVGQQAKTDCILGNGLEMPLPELIEHTVSSFWLKPILNSLVDGGGKKEKDGPYLYCVDANCVMHNI